MNVLNKH